jgi:hypothetical protein
MTSIHSVFALFIQPTFFARFVQAMQYPRLCRRNPRLRRRNPYRNGWTMLMILTMLIIGISTAID